MLLLNAHDSGANGVTHVPIAATAGDGRSNRGRIGLLGARSRPVRCRRSKARPLKAIAMMSKAAFWVLLPTLPSAHEQGLANFDASSWYGIFAAKGTPAPILRKAPCRHRRGARYAVGAEADDRSRRRRGCCQPPLARVSADFRREKTSRMWAEIIKKAGITPE